MERTDDNQINKCWSDSERAKKEIKQARTESAGQAAVLEHLSREQKEAREGILSLSGECRKAKIRCKGP